MYYSTNRWNPNRYNYSGSEWIWNYRQSPKALGMKPRH